MIAGWRTTRLSTRFRRPKGARLDLTPGYEETVNASGDLSVVRHRTGKRKSDERSSGVFVRDVSQRALSVAQCDRRSVIGGRIHRALVQPDAMQDQRLGCPAGCHAR